MSDARALLQAGYGVFRRDLQTFLSYRVRLVTQLLGALFSLTLYHFLSRLVHAGGFASPESYYAFAVVGLLILSILNSTLATPPAVMRGELVAGTFERVFVSPFGPIGVLVATLMFPFCFAVFNSLILLTFAGLVFGLPVHWSTLPLALPVSVLGAASFMPFGIILLAVVIVVKQAAAGTTWVIAGISLIGGLYFPVSLLPNWIRWTSSVQPFTPATDLLRHELVNRPLPDPAWIDVLKLVGFTVVLLPLALAVLQRALGWGRRRGTLIEY